MAKFANILYDDAFKVVMTEPSNQGLLIKLIEFFLPGKVIKELTLNDKEQHGLILSDKSCTFDLYCTTDTGEQMIVEMQYSSQESLRDRMLYYSTYPIRSQLMERFKQTEEANRVRKKMDYSLRPVYVICILNFEMAHESEETLEDGMISRYDLRSGRNGELMTDALHFVYLELGRLRWGQDEQEKCRTLLEQLAFSLKYGHLLNERPQDFEDDLLRMLFDATAFANMDEKELEKYTSIMRTEIDIIAQQEYARKQGEAKGKAEGKAEGRIEIMRKLLSSGMSLEELQQRLNLSDKEVAAIMDPDYVI